MRGAGSYYLIFIGLLLCVAGAAFVLLMWRSFDRASDQREWREVECVILESSLERQEIGAEQFRFVVHYGYEFEGKAYTSKHYSLRGSKWRNSAAEAEKLVEKFPVSSTHRCYLDPADPAFAILKLDSRAPGYSLWFPLIFVVGGLGIILGAVRELLRRRPVE